MWEGESILYHCVENKKITQNHNIIIIHVVIIEIDNA